MLADNAEGAGPSSSPRLLTVELADAEGLHEECSLAAIVFPDGIWLERRVDDGSWLGEAIHASAAETLARAGGEMRS